jgi:hypothetical protein
MAMQRFATAIDAATSITTINIERLAIAIYGISAIIFVAIYLAKTWSPSMTHLYSRRHALELRAG